MFIYILLCDRVHIYWNSRIFLLFFKLKNPIHIASFSPISLKLRESRKSLQWEYSLTLWLWVCQLHPQLSRVSAIKYTVMPRDSVLDWGCYHRQKSQETRHCHWVCVPFCNNNLIWLLDHILKVCSLTWLSICSLSLGMTRPALLQVLTLPVALLCWILANVIAFHSHFREIWSNSIYSFLSL